MSETIAGVFCPNAVEWGPIAAWVAAGAAWLGAIGTVGTLSWAVANGLRLRREEAAEKKRANDEALRAQARHVYARTRPVNSKVLRRDKATVCGAWLE